MGKFTNTQYKDTINNLIQAQTSKLDNPYYIFTDQKGTVVEYYAQNIEKTTLDQAARIEYSKLGNKSPIKFNLVHDFVLYGIDKINISLNNGDFGLEADPIEGEAVIMPNTLVPTPGDYFIISYIKENILFFVNDVSFDTLDTGSNAYKVNYKLQYTDKSKIDQINSQVVKEFNFIAGTVGTNYSAIIEAADYTLVSELETLRDTLIKYFKEIFFDDRVQTFIYLYNCAKFYDPYSIEFMIRNKLFSSSSEYTYVTHQIENKKTFSLSYDRTFFKSLETHNNADLQLNFNANCEGITDSNTLFGVRAETYFAVDLDECIFSRNRVPIIPLEIIDKILNNELYPAGNPLSIFNLWISYANSCDDYLNADALAILKKYNFTNNNISFYGMLISIFILGNYINTTMSQHSSK